jgi:uncharacterized iron-regulated membrane protein
MVTGLILWWPGVKRITRGFSVRLRRGFYPLNYDLHQAAGALALPLLFVITLTGVLIPYQRQAEMVLRIALGDAGAVERTPVTVPPLVQPGPTDLVERAQHIVPDGRPTMLRMPATGGNAQVDVLRGGHGVAGGTVSVMLDPTDASIVSVRDPRTASDARRLAGPFNFNVHIGAVGGPLVRVLYVIVCLMGAAVAVTGFTIWWLKRTRVGENATAIVASAVR